MHSVGVMADSRTLTESAAAFENRAREVGLLPGEIASLKNAGIISLARLAFALCPPGQTPSDTQVDQILGNPDAGVTAGTRAAVKRLVFESHTLIVAELQQKVKHGDEGVASTLAPAERESRLESQRRRLTGLSLVADEECAFESYNLVHNMLQQHVLLYLAPEKFATRRAELQSKKPAKELVLDAKQGVTVKDKALDLQCSTSTELELTQAMRRRALAFDLVGCCSYDAMNRYHSYLIQRLQEAPPPGYGKITLIQILRADRAAFTHIAESIRSLRRKPDGSKPLDAALASCVNDPSVAFHLLPLPQSSSSSHDRPPKRKFDEGGKGRGRGKGRFSSTKGVRVPKELIGKSWQTTKGKRVCWDFNLEKGCSEARPGQACPKGLRICAEPGCFKAHSLTQHPSS